MNRFVMVLLAASCCWSVPERAAAEPRDPNHEVGEPLWVGGLAVLGGTYFLTGATVTTLRLLTSSREDRIWQGWVPVLGPFLMLADPAGLDGAQLALTAVSGVLQVLGLGALITGVVLDAQPDPVDAAGRSLVLVPVGSAASIGVALHAQL